MSVKKLLFVAAVFVILCPGFLPAEDSYRIERIVYHITGITRESALKTKLLQENYEIAAGTEFPSKQELEAYLADRKQVIINFRVIASAEVTYRELPATAGVIPVQVDVYTKDTWNIFALPYFEYDSNTGLKLMIKARDYNFLGTMENLRVNLYYLQRSSEFTLSITLPLNFPLFGLNWTFTPSQGLEIDDDDSYDDYYLTTGVDLSSKVSTPWTLGPFPVKYNFGVFSDISYTLDPDDPISEYRRGLNVGFKHGLSNGRTDWIGNFRNGYGLGLSNTYEYNLHHFDWSRAVSFEADYYKALSPFGLSARFKTFYNFDEDDDAGGPLRGILDDRMYGNTGFYVNADLALKIFTWPKLFEMQAAAFFDTGIAKTMDGSFDAENLMFGGGIELFFFPAFARSVYIRASLGMDLKAVLETRALGGSYKREIFIGVGHHY